MRPLCGPALLAALLILVAAPAVARPYTLDDHLRREELGRAEVSADGRWIVWERRLPYREGGRFDYDRFNDLFRTRLEVIDLEGALGRRALGQAAAGAGYALGPLSPDGVRAAVYRLQDGRWRLGVADLAARSVRWLALSPEISDYGQTVLWRSPAELLVIATAPGVEPFALRWARPQAQVASRWRAAAGGEASTTVYGSGRYLGLTPRDPPRRLVRIDAATGAETELLTGDFTDMALAPDGGALALLEAGEDIPLAAGAPVQGEAGVATRRLHLRLLDLDAGGTYPGAAGWDLLAHLLAWSPDGAEVLVFGRSGGAWRDGRLLRVARRSGRATPLPGPGLDFLVRRRPEAVRAGWLGGAPIVWARDAGGGSGWRRWSQGRWAALTQGSAPGEPAATSDGRLIALKGTAAWAVGAGGDVRLLAGEVSPVRLGRGGIPRRTDMAIPEGGMLVRRRERDGAVLFRLTATGPRALARVGADEAVIAVGAEGALVRAVRGGGREILSWRPTGGGRRPLLTLNGHLEAVTPPKVCAVQHKGPDGAALTSWVALPVGRAAAPLVVWPYPGRVHRTAPSAFDPRQVRELATPLVLAGQGYAVLLPSLPTPAGADGPAAGLGERILAIVDAAAAAPCARGRIDAARLGLWGHSFGGYAALVTAVQTDRFSAIVAAAAPADLSSLHGEFGHNRRLSPEEGVATPWTAGWVESLQGGMKAPPWAAADRYVRNSPLFSADKVETPLLIVHGELDGFPLGQAEMMFSALYRQGKDAQLVTYWREGHTFQSPVAIADLHRRALAFLEEHLLLTRGRAGPRPGSGPASAGPRLPRRRRAGGLRRRRCGSGLRG